MAKLILNAYSAESKGGFISMALCIGGEPAFPSKSVEIKTAADCAAALDAYKAEAKATGQKLAVSMMMARGERKPPGFNKLKAGRSYETVNLD